MTEIVGAPGMGKRTLVAQALAALSSRNVVRRVYQYMFHESLKATIAEALIGRNGQWPAEGRRLDEAKRALAESPRPCSLVLTGVPAEEVENRENRRLIADLLAMGISIILTVDSEDESSGGSDGAADSIADFAEEVVTLGALNIAELVQVAESTVFQVSCGLLSIDKRSAKRLVTAASRNLKLLEVASAVVGIGFSIDEVVGAMGQDDSQGRVSAGRCVDGLLSLLFAENRSAVGRAVVALTVLPPEGVCAAVLNSMGVDRANLQCLVRTGFLMRDTVSARYLVSGNLVRRALQSISAKRSTVEYDIEPECEVANCLWSLFQSGVGREVIGELVSCYENLIGMFGGQQASLTIGLWRARLSRLYGRLGRTWLCLKSDESVLGLLAELNEEEAFDPDGPLQNTSGVNTKLALARQYIKLGISQMRYALRGDAIKSFDAAMNISESLDDYSKLEVQARALRERGWTLHEEYKRGGRNPIILNEAISTKNQALERLDQLSRLGVRVSGRQRQNILSTLAFSLIEGNREQREEAPYYAEEGLLKLYAEVKPDEDEMLILLRPERALGNIVDRRDRMSVAEAVYFLGRVLGGGDNPETNREGEGKEERFRRLEESLRFERAALEVREKELGEMNMTLAYNLASIGILHKALGKTDEAKRCVWKAMKIQLSRFHCSVVSASNRLSGVADLGLDFRCVPTGPITDACEELFPGRLTNMGYRLAAHAIGA